MLLRVTRPVEQNISCTVGIACSITLVGDRFAQSNQLLIIQGGRKGSETWD